MALPLPNAGTVESARALAIDEEKNQQLSFIKLLNLITVLPVCVVGMVGNALSVWVWNADSQRRQIPTLAPFLQFLAVVDALFLLTTWWLSVVVMQYTQLLSPQSIIKVPLVASHLLSCLSLSTTVLIGALRWLAVTRNQWRWVQQISGRGVAFACMGLTVWSITVAELDVLRWELFTSGGVGALVMIFLALITGLILPIMLLFGITVALIFTLPHQWYVTATNAETFRVTMMVMLIVGGSCTLSAMVLPPLVFGVLTTNNYVPDILCNSNIICILAISSVTMFLQAFNSAVKFLIYVTVTRKFRKQLFRKFRRIMCCASTEPPREELRASTSRVSPGQLPRDPSRTTVEPP